MHSLSSINPVQTSSVKIQPQLFGSNWVENVSLSDRHDLVEKEKI